MTFMGYVSAPLRYPFAAIFGALVCLAGLSLFPSALPSLEQSLFPVADGWRVETAVRDGDDLLLTGTMIRERPCRFLPPVVARNERGQNLKLVHQSAIGGTSWAPSSEPQKWGPWRIVGGAGQVLSVTRHG